MTVTLKKVFAVIAVVVVVALTVSLVACTPNFTPLDGGDPTAASESNNGYVVKQGEFYYFINGYTASSDITKAKDNKFGNVVKGAIMRAKKNAEGKFDANAGQVVVPMMVTSTNLDQGFSIFGEYLYYTTPSTKTDKYGALQTSYLEYRRCKITGANTETIAILSGDVTSFKFTPDSLIYLEGKELKRVNYANKSTTTIAENVTNQVFPASEKYTPGQLSPSDYVYYTVTPENTDGTYNELYAVSGNADPIKLAGDGTFGEGKKITVKPMYVMVEADGTVILYYEKTNNTDGRTDALGLFGIKLGTGALSDVINVENEKWFTVQSGLSVMPYTFDGGVLVDTTDAQSKYFYFSSVDANGNVIGREVKYRYPSGYTLAIYKIIKEGDKEYLYYTNANSLFRIQLNTTSGINFDEGTATLIASNIKTDWLELEKIGNDVFLMHTKYLTYIHVFDLNAINSDSFDKTVGLERKDLTLLGKMTDADKESYDDMIADEDKADKE